MKKIHFLPWLALVALLLMAFVPSMTDFNPNQFPTTGNKVSIINGAFLTNIFVFNNNSVIVGKFGANGELEDKAGNKSVDFYAKQLHADTGSLSLDWTNRTLYSENGAFRKMVWTNNVGGPVFPPLTASTVLQLDSLKALTSIPNGTGSLTNDGAGVIGWSTASGGATQGGVQTNSILQATNIIGIQDSICIPAGGFFSFNLTAPSTVATFIAVTNLCEGWVFADSVTNEIRARFSLPYDWDGGTVKMQISALCTGTNANVVNQTNVVFAVAAAALPPQADLSSQTFGTAIRVTNALNKAAWVEGNAVTAPITVGNTPNSTKSILWQIQRLGADAGDTCTNSSVVLTEARVFFVRNLNTTNSPAASP